MPNPRPASAPAVHVAPLHALVSIAALLTFARAVPYPLQLGWDDGRFIADNADVRAPSLQALQSIFGAQHFEAYHPLHLLSYWLDVPWAGAHGPVLHAVSLALWVVALNLLLRAFLALGLGAAAAVIATLACGLHPAQVEAVSWATGRKDVLALLWSAAALLAHARSSDWLDARAWLARACYLLAALSKTTALPLPLVLLLADVLLQRRSLRVALRAQAPALLLGAGLAAGVLVIWAQHTMIRSTSGGLAALPLRVVATFGHQLGTALWPAATSPMYSTARASAPSAGDFVLAAAALGLGVLALRAGLRRALFALGAFALLMLPVSNAVPMYFPFQDRYLSLPLVGLAFGLGAGVDALRAAGGGRAVLMIGGALVLALALRCVQYQGAWQSEARLWGHAASTQPDAYYAFMKLGEVRRNAGDLDGALRAYAQLPRIDPVRKVGYAALLQTAALRDERMRALSPSRAERYAADYYAEADSADGLLALAARMLQSGHLRALELPLRRSLQLRPVPDAALEHAAQLHADAGRPTLAAFYVRQMRQPPQRAELRALAAQHPAVF